MTCKDCIHYDVCYAVKAVGENQESDKYCMSFKNKADYTEVKHGKWRKPQFVGRSGFRSVRDFICGICGKEYAVEQPCNLMNHCPNCGAKMDGRSDI